MERISENHGLIWAVLHILLYFFKACEIFGEVINFSANHIGESYFSLSFVVSSRCILCLLCNLLWRVRFPFIFVFILSSRLLGIFIWCCLHHIDVRSFGRCGSGFCGNLRCGSGVARLSRIIFFSDGALTYPMIPSICASGGLAGS